MRMQIRIRDAKPEDAGFLAWALLTAHRGHLKQCMWDIRMDGDEAKVLDYLEILAGTKALHWCHYSIFLIAEVDGRPASTLCGYLESELGADSRSLGKGLKEANQAFGLSEEEAQAGFERISSILHVEPEHAHEIWVVENVATRPEYRRLGLIDRLMKEILDRGLGLGAKVSDISVLIGNDKAQRAYEKNGFAVCGEKVHPEFEAVYGTPGIRTLTREI